MKATCILCEKYICKVTDLSEDKVNAICCRCLELLEKQEQRFIENLIWYKQIIKKNVNFEQ
jgi:hypothetical protein